MTFDQLIQQFASQTGTPPLSANAEGQYPITADGVTVLCFYAAHQVYLLGELTTLDNDENTQLLQITQLLQTCLVNLDNSRESISLSENTLQIHRQLILNNLTQQNFLDAVSDFFDSIFYLKGTLNDKPASHSQPLIMP